MLLFKADKRGPLKHDYVVLQADTFFEILEKAEEADDDPDSARTRTD